MRNFYLKVCSTIKVTISFICLLIIAGNCTKHTTLFAGQSKMLKSKLAQQERVLAQHRSSDLYRLNVSPDEINDLTETEIVSSKEKKLVERNEKLLERLYSDLVKEDFSLKEIDWFIKFFQLLDFLSEKNQEISKTTKYQAYLKNIFAWIEMVLYESYQEEKKDSAYFNLKKIFTQAILTKSFSKKICEKILTELNCELEKNRVFIIEVLISLDLGKKLLSLLNSEHATLICKKLKKLPINSKNAILKCIITHGSDRVKLIESFKELLDISDLTQVKFKVRCITTDNSIEFSLLESFLVSSKSQNKKYATFDFLFRELVEKNQNLENIARLLNNAQSNDESSLFAKILLSDFFDQIDLKQKKELFDRLIKYKANLNYRLYQIDINGRKTYTTPLEILRRKYCSIKEAEYKEFFEYVVYKYSHLFENPPQVIIYEGKEFHRADFILNAPQNVSIDRLENRLEKNIRKRQLFELECILKYHQKCISEITNELQKAINSYNESNEYESTQLEVSDSNQTLHKQELNEVIEKNCRLVQQNAQELPEDVCLQLEALIAKIIESRNDVNEAREKNLKEYQALLEKHPELKYNALAIFVESLKNGDEEKEKDLVNIMHWTPTVLNQYLTIVKKEREREKELLLAEERQEEGTSVEGFYEVPSYLKCKVYVAIPIEIRKQLESQNLFDKIDKMLKIKEKKNIFIPANAQNMEGIKCYNDLTKLVIKGENNGDYRLILGKQHKTTDGDLIFEATEIITHKNEKRNSDHFKKNEMSTTIPNLNDYINYIKNGDILT